MSQIDLIKVYQQQVDALASEGTAFRISNRNVAHAAVLLDAIFKNAKQEVRLFCGAFNEDFYSQEHLKAAIIDFLHKPGTRLLILTQKPLDKRHKVIHSLQPYLDGKVEVRHLNGDCKKSHFAVMDRKGYRFEFAHDPHDRSIVEAVANFNEPETAVKLADQFDEMFATSKSI